MEQAEGALTLPPRCREADPNPLPALRGEGKFEAHAMNRGILEELLAARKRRQAVALVTELASGSQRIVARSDAAKDKLAAILDEAFRFDQSGMHEGHFINIHNPPLRLV